MVAPEDEDNFRGDRLESVIHVIPVGGIATITVEEVPEDEDLARVFDPIDFLEGGQRSFASSDTLFARIAVREVQVPHEQNVPGMFARNRPNAPGFVNKKSHLQRT